MISSSVSPIIPLPIPPLEGSSFELFIADFLSKAQPETGSNDEIRKLLHELYNKGYRIHSDRIISGPKGQSWPELIGPSGLHAYSHLFFNNFSCGDIFKQTLNEYLLGELRHINAAIADLLPKTKVSMFEKLRWKGVFQTSPPTFKLNTLTESDVMGAVLFAYDDNRMVLVQNKAVLALSETLYLLPAVKGQPGNYHTITNEITDNPCDLAVKQKIKLDCPSFIREIMPYINALTPNDVQQDLYGPSSTIPVCSSSERDPLTHTYRIQTFPTNSQGVTTVKYFIDRSKTSRQSKIKIIVRPSELHTVIDKMHQSITSHQRYAKSFCRLLDFIMLRKGAANITYSFSEGDPKTHTPSPSHSGILLAFSNRTTIEGKVYELFQKHLIEACKTHNLEFVWLEQHPKLIRFKA